MKQKILLAIGIVLIFAGLSVISCQPEGKLASPDLPRYTEEQVTKIAFNYFWTTIGKEAAYAEYSSKASYKGNGIWEVKVSYTWYTASYSDTATVIFIFDERTGVIH